MERMTENEIEQFAIELLQCEWGSGRAKPLIIYKKSSRNSRFLVLNIQFWVQSNELTF